MYSWAANYIYLLNMSYPTVAVWVCITFQVVRNKTICSSVNAGRDSSSVRILSWRINIGDGDGDRFSLTLCSLPEASVETARCWWSVLFHNLAFWYFPARLICLEGEDFRRQSLGPRLVWLPFSLTGLELFFLFRALRARENQAPMVQLKCLYTSQQQANEYNL